MTCYIILPVVKEQLKTETINIEISPLSFQLPLENCLLTVNCEPVSNEERQYQYTLALRSFVRGKVLLDKIDFSSTDNILPLSRFTDLTSGVHDYILHVTCSNLHLEGHKSGKIRIYPGKLLP